MKDEKLAFLDMLSGACQKALTVVAINQAQQKAEESQSAFFDDLWDPAMIEFLKFAQKLLDSGIDCLLADDGVSGVSGATRAWVDSERKILVELMKSVAFLLEYEKAIRGEIR